MLTAGKTRARYFDLSPGTHTLGKILGKVSTPRRLRCEPCSLLETSWLGTWRLPRPVQLQARCTGPRSICQGRRAGWWRPLAESLLKGPLHMAISSGSAGEMHFNVETGKCPLSESWGLRAEFGVLTSTGVLTRSSTGAKCQRSAALHNVKPSMSVPPGEPAAGELLLASDSSFSCRIAASMSPSQSSNDWLTTCNARQFVQSQARPAAGPNA